MKDRFFELYGAIEIPKIEFSSATFKLYRILINNALEYVNFES